MRKLVLAALAALALSGLAASPAAAHPTTPRVLLSVHAGRDMTWHWQSLDGRCCTPYGWLADRQTTSMLRRWQIATAWWARAATAHTTYVHWLRTRSAVPAWFTARMPCLARNEEYGPPWEGGYTTSAGYFGMISSPASYPGSGGIVAQYGNSWMGIPYTAQIVIVYAEWRAKGSSPWPNTAPGCGL